MQRTSDDFEKGLGNGRPPSPHRHTWLSLLLLTLFSIPILQPLARGELTCGFDNAFHLWRAVQMGELLQQGVWFSRWAPHMAQGYGYPLYLFQSPLSAYLVAGLHGIGLAWPVALNGVYALAIVASGWAMWLLARELWGEKGGMVAAVAYLYAPFHAYVTFYRASLSEAVAWAIVPLVLWGLYRWQMRRERKGLVTAVLAFIALIFTHDVTAYAFLPFMVGWVVTLALMERSWAGLGCGFGALALGIGGSAFFWLPAVVERPSVQFERANSAWPFLYFNNFLPLEQLLALPRNADPTLLNDWPERGLGLLLVVLAMVGTAVAWKRLPQQRWLTAYLALALVGYTLLTVAATRPLWDTITLLQTFQFPWRFLAPASFVAALLVGGVLTVNSEQLTVNSEQYAIRTTHYALRITDYGLPLTIFFFLAVAHFGWLYPQHCAAPVDTTQAGMAAWERDTDTLGTTASRELLPVWVQQMPEDTADLPVWDARLSTADLPEGATILQAAGAPLRAEIEVETAVPFIARFRSFYFPGWRAWVDGQEVAITPSEPEGLITLVVPDGRHTLLIAFTETPLRLFADALSLLSLSLLAAIAWKTQPARQQRITDHGLRITTSKHWLPALFAVGLAMLAAKWLVDQEYTSLHQSRLADGELVGVAIPQSLTFGEPAKSAMVRLLGHDEWETAAPTDTPLAISLYWQALTPLNKDYRVGLTLVDEQGLRWSEVGLRDYRWTRNAPPTQEWPLDQYVQTAFFVDALSGTPPGIYNLQLSLFDRETLQPLTVYQDGRPLGPQVNLGQIELLPPRQPLDTAALVPLISPELAGGITIFQVAADRTTAAPGDSLLFTMFWQMPGEVETAVTLTLLDENGTAVQSWPLPLPAYGEGVWRSQFPLTLLANLEAGEYIWQLTFPNGQNTPLDSSLVVDAPERRFEQPPVGTTVNETLFLDEQPLATLIGYMLDEERCKVAPATCSLTLLWRVEDEFPGSFRVFAQVLDSGSRLVAQSDGVPANWTRPTTGWLPGEYILDEHQLVVADDIAPGEYQFIAGMYGEDEGRLVTDAGADFIVLGTFAFEGSE
jgi:hypothetical protein